MLTAAQQATAINMQKKLNAWIKECLANGMDSVMVSNMLLGCTAEVCIRLGLDLSAFHDAARKVYPLVQHVIKNQMTPEEAITFGTQYKKDGQS